MKAHEETWVADPDSPEVVRLPNWDIVSNSDASGPDPDNTEWAKAVARTRLIAAAPEMARMLLKLEWSADIRIDCDVTEPGCPSCGHLKSESTYPGARSAAPVGHDDDCSWLALMRKAGVRT